MKRLCTPAWMVRHALTVALVVGFLWLGWWQISRAASGNTLSWAYAVEWPIFAGFVVFLWVREARITLGGDQPVSTSEPVTGIGSRSRADREADRRLETVPPNRVEIRRPVRFARLQSTVSTDDGVDPDLAAYNDYLSWLSANPGARPRDYPG